MKRLQSTIFLFCVAFWIDTNASSTETKPQEQAVVPTSVVTTDSKSDEKEATPTAPADLTSQPDTVIIFFAQNDDPDTDKPSGRYWPSDSIITMQGKSINSASAYIGDNSYSEVTVEKNLLPNQELRYLGHFIDTPSGDMMYVYGTKDHIIPNDANEETLVLSDDSDEEDDDDE